MHACSPIFERHQTGIELSVNKRVGKVLPVGRFDDVALPGNAGNQPAVPLHAGGCGRLRRGLHSLPQQNITIDHQATARSCDQKPLVHQHLQSQRHRVARQTQRNRQCPTGGHFGTHRHQAYQDGMHHHFFDLALQCRAAARELREQFGPDTCDFLLLPHYVSLFKRVFLMHRLGVLHQRRVFPQVSWQPDGAFSTAR